MTRVMLPYFYRTIKYFLSKAAGILNVNGNYAIADKVSAFFYKKSF